MILASIFALIGMQAAGETPLAIQPEKPKTWEVEYPYIMSPYVDDYRNCLNSVVRTIGDNVPFETQHRADIPRCSEVAIKAVNESNAVLAKSERSNGTTPQDVDSVFETVRQIHIERGKDLDAQINMRLAVNPVYREGSPSAPATAKMAERLRREAEANEAEVNGPGANGSGTVENNPELGVAHHNPALGPQ
ncbi:MAG: hypothetical protein WAT93_11660 [Pontixanthobacter sp.]